MQRALTPWGRNVALRGRRRASVTDELAVHIFFTFCFTFLVRLFWESHFFRIFFTIFSHIFHNFPRENAIFGLPGPAPRPRPQGQAPGAPRPRPQGPEPGSSDPQTQAPGPRAGAPKQGPGPATAPAPIPAPTGLGLHRTRGIGSKPAFLLYVCGGVRSMSRDIQNLSELEWILVYAPLMAQIHE